MNDKARYVFDTNVIVSALLFEQSKPAQAFYAALDRGDILLSQPVLRELNEVLAREKLKPYLLFEERVEFITAFVTEAIFIDIKKTYESAVILRMTNF